MKRMNMTVMAIVLAVSVLFLYVFLTRRTSAEIVFLNGVVYTANENHSRAEAVAVQKGKIVFVGSTGHARSFINKRTVVIDLQGKMLLPGFHDSHVHALEGGVALGMCNLSSLKNADEYLRALKEYAAVNPEREWVTGFGWSLEAFPGGNPGKGLLDEIIPDRPVAVMCNDGHSVWVNSAGLREAEISAATTDPVDGRIERDAKGEPTGTLREGAMELVRKKAMEPSIFEAYEGLEKGVALLNSFGVTSFIEARAITADSYDLLYRLVNALGDLKARVTLSLYLDPKRGDEQVGELVAKYDGDTASRVKADQVKIFLDGVTETKTAWLLQHYAGEPGNFGIPVFDMKRLSGYAAELERAGFQLHMHAIGDRAVREGLNLVESVRHGGGRGEGRHHLVHLYLVDEMDMPRFAVLNVTGNIQAQWACPASYNEVNRRNLGEGRFKAQFPFASLNKKGARMAGGSDWPVDIANPLEAIQVALTRQVPGTGKTGAALNAGERLDLETMLDAYTINGAWLQRREALTGSIEAGKLADIIVLDRDLFSIDAQEISGARVLLTLLDGVPVYRSSWAENYFKQ